jgi:signal peptidase I
MNKEGDSKSKFARFFKKFWQIVWKDDSFKGWLISLIFIFIIIKFVFFPLLSLATGTSLPLAIVESCSMYHKGNVFDNFNNWWERHDSKYGNIEIEKSKFESFNFKRGFSKGDILFIVKAKPEKLKIGDVIIFNAGQQNPIIHRIINITHENGEYVFSTMGDNNNGQLSVETEIKSEQLVGKAVFRIAPSVGWAKLVFYEHLRPQNERGFCKES